MFIASSLILEGCYHAAVTDTVTPFALLLVIDPIFFEKLILIIFIGSQLAVHRTKVGVTPYSQPIRNPSIIC